MTKALDTDAPEKWAEADERFHKLLIHWGQAYRVRMVTLRLRPKPSSSTLDHEALVGAIEEGTPSVARRIHHEHRRCARRMLIGLLRKHGLSSL